ncbi:MAG: hypothetical protein E4H28_06595 [Gemmatimonadales bacterium]|nr:MAG: hypothetical protein E4H28_06595 [Gemmatimonadales bacterium]
MKRLTVLAASLLVLAAGVPAGTARAAKAESNSCCWLYCESYRMICERSFGEDGEYCKAFYEGCIDGCQYSKG